MSAAATTVSPSSKEDLSFFQERRRRWQQAKRTPIKRVSSKTSSHTKNESSPSSAMSPQSFLSTPKSGSASFPLSTNAPAPLGGSAATATTPSFGGTSAGGGCSISKEAFLATLTPSVGSTKKEKEPTKKQGNSSSAFPPMSVSAPTPFGATATSVPSSKSPTRIPAFSTTTAAPAFGSTNHGTSFSPASPKASTLFNGVADAVSSPSKIPTFSKIATAPTTKPAFGSSTTSNTPTKANNNNNNTTSAFLPMSSKEAPNPFGGGSTFSSSSDDPSKKTPSFTFSSSSKTGIATPAFGLTSSDANGEKSKPTSLTFPPLSTKAPLPFGGGSAFSAGDPTKKTPNFSFSSSSTTATPAFGFSTSQAKEEKSKPISSAFPPMSAKAPTPFGGVTSVSSGSDPSKKTPSFTFASTTGVTTPAGTETSNEKKSQPTASAFPPMSTKAPTPFGGGSTSISSDPSKKTPSFDFSSSSETGVATVATPAFGSSTETSNPKKCQPTSSSFPPMSTKAPTPFGGVTSASSSSDPAKKTLSSSFSSSSKTDIKSPAFGSSSDTSNQKESKPSSSMFPPISTKAPTPFGGVTAASTSNSDPSKETPSFSFSSLSKPSSSTPAFGSTSDAKEKSKLPSSVFPPMSTKVPALFGGASASRTSTTTNKVAELSFSSSMTASTSQATGSTSDMSKKETEPIKSGVLQISTAASTPVSAAAVPSSSSNSGSFWSSALAAMPASVSPSSANESSEIPSSDRQPTGTGLGTSPVKTSMPSTVRNGGTCTSSQSETKPQKMSSIFANTKLTPRSPATTTSDTTSSRPTTDLPIDGGTHEEKPGLGSADSKKTTSHHANAGNDCTQTSPILEVDYRSRLVAFYTKHNPEKLPSVDATLAKYGGNEKELFHKLEAKYAKSKFPLAFGEGPTCFINFSIDGEEVGRVCMALFADKVPLTAENFRCLCSGEKGTAQTGQPLCYKNSKVHRVVKGFCVQLGDFTRGDGRGGESIYPPNSQHGDALGKFKDEQFMQHSKKGLLSMANNGANRNSSQFFFTLRAVPQLNGKHVVFGEVIEGIGIIERIAEIETNRKEQPTKVVAVSSCGEIKDGEEVTCIPAVTQTAFTKSSTFGFGKHHTGSTPFGFSGSGESTPSNVFGFSKSQTNASPFGVPSDASSTTNTNQNGETKQEAKAVSPPFGKSGGSTKANPFSFGSTQTSGAAIATPTTFSSFSFGKAGSSLSADTSETNSTSFSFGGSGDDGATPTPFSFGAPSDSKESTVFPFSGNQVKPSPFKSTSPSNLFTSPLNREGDGAGGR